MIHYHVGDQDCDETAGCAQSDHVGSLHGPRIGDNAAITAPRHRKLVPACDGKSSFG